MLITLLLLAALGWSVRRNLPELQELRHHLTGLRPEWLLLGLVGQALFYLGVGATLCRALRATGGRATLKAATRSGLLYFFLGRGLPGPSVVALLLLIRSLAAQGSTTGQAAAAVSLFCFIDYASSFALAGVAAVWVALGAGATVGLLVLAYLLPTAWRLWGPHPRGGPPLRWPSPLLTALPRRLQRGRVGGHLEKAEVVWARLKRDGSAPQHLLALGVGLHLGGLLTLACVFRALGEPVPWGALPLADVAGNVGAVLSFLPGGLGAYEGSVSLVLAGAGVSWSLALTAALVYRAFTFWMLIPLGLWLYRREARVHA